MEDSAAFTEDRAADLHPSGARVASVVDLARRRVADVRDRRGGNRRVLGAVDQGYQEVEWGIASVTSLRDSEFSANYTQHLRAGLMCSVAPRRSGVPIDADC